MSVSSFRLTNTALARAGWALCNASGRCVDCGSYVDSNALFSHSSHPSPQCRMCASILVVRSQVAAINRVPGLNQREKLALKAITDRHAVSDPTTSAWSDMAQLLTLIDTLRAQIEG